MGKRFLRTIVNEPTTVAATGDITPLDLPVNPLSIIYLTMLLTEPAQQVTSAFRLFSDFYAAVNDISIRHKGEMIVQGGLGDLLMTNFLLHGQLPFGVELAGAAIERQMTFPIALTRRPYSGIECFPATSRGNLRFHMNVASITPGTATAWRFSVEAVEMVEDDPKQYLKYTTNTRVITATGRQRVPLPIGNDIVGVTLFDPSSEIDATAAYAWNKVKVLVDNVEQYYAESNWGSLRQSISGRYPLDINALGHRHSQAAADTTTSDEQKAANEPPIQYAYLDFDPLKDDANLLETAGHSDVELDMNSGVSTGTARYLPVELVRLK